MQDVLPLVIKALVGGSFVVMFALISCMVTPKTLAGVFGAAPSIACAALIVAVVNQGPKIASQAASGMMFGACGLLVYCIVVAILTAKSGALRASAMAMPAWGMAAVLVYAAVIR